MALYSARFILLAILFPQVRVIDCFPFFLNVIALYWMIFDEIVPILFSGASRKSRCCGAYRTAMGISCGPFAAR